MVVLDMLNVENSIRKKIWQTESSKFQSDFYIRDQSIGLIIDNYKLSINT